MKPKKEFVETNWIVELKHRKWAANRGAETLSGRRFALQFCSILSSPFTVQVQEIFRGHELGADFCNLQQYAFSNELKLLGQSNQLNSSLNRPQLYIWDPLDVSILLIYYSLEMEVPCGNPKWKLEVRRSFNGGQICISDRFVTNIGWNQFNNPFGSSNGQDLDDLAIPIWKLNAKLQIQKLVSSFCKLLQWSVCSASCFTFNIQTKLNDFQL